jgi:hypothetical protein
VFAPIEDDLTAALEAAGLPHAGRRSRSVARLPTIWSGYCRRSGYAS